jgi:hypothetical protein
MRISSLKKQNKTKQFNLLKCDDQKRSLLWIPVTQFDLQYNSKTRIYDYVFTYNFGIKQVPYDYFGL